MEMDKEQVWISKLYGCMFPGSPCHTWTETDGNILYLALLLLLGGEVTQFSLRMVNCLHRLHKIFFFYSVLIADDYADMWFSTFVKSMQSHELVLV